MIGALIGSAIGAAGSIFGGIKAAKAARDARRRVEREKKENAAWYTRNYYEDPTKRASALAVLNRTEESIMNRNKAAAGRQAVMGGTEDSVTAAREANSEALADATGHVVAANDARKDAVEQQYQERKSRLNDQLNGIDTQRATAIGGAVQGLTAAAGDIGDAFDGRKKNKEDSVRG